MNTQLKNGVRLPVQFSAQLTVDDARVDHIVLPERQLRQSFAGSGDILADYGVHQSKDEQEVVKPLHKAG